MNNIQKTFVSGVERVASFLNIKHDIKIIKTYFSLSYY